MKIKSATFNNRMKRVEIFTSSKDHFTLPFSKLELIPTAQNPIKVFYIDKELAYKGITYVLESGEEDSVLLDQFLDYNEEPEYMRKATLYNLTCQAQDLLKKSRLSKRELARKLKTSPAQLYRLLDQTNYSKTIDQMMKLLGSLGYTVEFTTHPTKSKKVA